MGWAVGYDDRWKRDIGYGVPSICDHPGCGQEINRGLDYVCGGEPYGGNHGCGLYFCEEHRLFSHDANKFLCDRCCNGEEPYKPTPDTLEWIGWKLTDGSWEQWRNENPDKVEQMNPVKDQG